MRPTVPQLLGWRPLETGADGEALVTRAADIRRAADRLTTVGAGMAGAWSGKAADAATKHVTARADEIESVADVVEAAGSALARAGREINKAKQMLAAARTAALAGGFTVGDDGTVLPPPMAVAPLGLAAGPLAAWRIEQVGVASDQAALADRLAAQVNDALSAAAAADEAGARALDRLKLPTISPAPKPDRLKSPGGLPGDALRALPFDPTFGLGAKKDRPWYGDIAYQAGGFSTGVYDGLVDTGTLAAGLLGIKGDAADNWKALRAGLIDSVVNPKESAKSAVGYEDLAAQEYGHWAGSIVGGVGIIGRLGKIIGKRNGETGDSTSQNITGIAPGPLGRDFSPAINDPSNLVTDDERPGAQWLAEQGQDVRVRPPDHTVQGKKNPDYIVRKSPDDPGTLTELKTLTSANSTTVRRSILDAAKQLEPGGGGDALIDGRDAGLTRVDAERGWARAVGQARTHTSALPNTATVLLGDGTHMIFRS